MSIEREIVLLQLKAVLIGEETVLMRVKMAEVLTDKYFVGENCIRNVIL